MLFDLPNAAQLITDAIRDLQYVCSYTGEVSNCHDLITQFKGDYNISPSIDISSAAKTHEYTKLKLDKIYRAFGLENRIKENTSTEEKVLKPMIKEALERFSGALLYLDDHSAERHLRNVCTASSTIHIRSNAPRLIFRRA